MTSYIVSEFLFDSSQFDLSSKAKAVMAYLAFRSNKMNTCFPALKTIASGCSLSLSTVKRAIRELLSFRLINKDERYRADGGQTSNLYTLNQEALTIKEKVRKKKTSFQSRTDLEEVFFKKSLYNNNTPGLTQKTSPNVKISHSTFFPCRNSEQNGEENRPVSVEASIQEDLIEEIEDNGVCLLTTSNPEPKTKKLHHLGQRKNLPHTLKLIFSYCLLKFKNNMRAFSKDYAGESRHDRTVYNVERLEMEGEFRVSDPPPRSQ